MKVVLQKNVENIGNEGEIKNVADGFARNFLIPNGLAEPATKSSIQKAQARIVENQKQEKEELQNQQMLAEKVDGKEILIKAKAEDGKLFGSIDKRRIAQQLKENGMQFDESSINLPSPIKELGEHQIQINLKHGIEADIKLVVEEE